MKTPTELISEYWLEPSKNPQTGEEDFSTIWEVNQVDKESIRAQKPEIMAILRECRDAALAAQAVEQARIAANAVEKIDILNGTKNIEVEYVQGNFLSAYSACGASADTLEEFGLATYIGEWGLEWGLLVDENTVEKPGASFSYIQVSEYLGSKRKATAVKKAVGAAVSQFKFELARISGKEVRLESHSIPCPDPTVECDMDIVHVMAMPDGTTKKAQYHTY